MSCTYNECTDMYGCTDVDMYIMYAQLLQPTLANVTGHLHLITACNNINITTEADTYIQYVRLLRPTLANVTGHEICISSQLAIIVLLQRLTLAGVTGSSLGQLFSHSCFSSHRSRLKFLCFYIDSVLCHTCIIMIYVC